MLKSEPLRELVIHNGKLEDPDYEYEFHCFFEGKILKVMLLVPGIIGESVLITTSGTHFEMTAHVNSKYLQIFKSRKLHLSGELPVEVLEGVLVAKYEDGILSVELVRISY